MDLAELISDSRQYLEPFDLAHYVRNFELFEEQLKNVISGQENLNAAELIDTLEARRKALLRWKQKRAADEEKRVLALFFSPAAKRLGDPYIKFADDLSQLWNERYPKNKFFAGDYDAIVSGFDSKIFGIPIRKD